MLPIYDPLRSYLENAVEGPFFTGEIPQRKTDKTIDFLGFPIFSPLGVPAGPLLNSKWIILAAKLGFDVLTYKTIRSFAHVGHPLPNILFVKAEGDRARQADTADFPDISITNSFGMPSMSPDFLMQDIGRANAALEKGQVMIVSVVGTPNRGKDFLEDFVESAKLAKDAGAKIIEANFSCPNVDPKEGCLYLSPETVFLFSKKIVEAIAPVPLLIKVGLFANFAQMRTVFLAAARAGVKGIAGLNSVSMEVLNAEGSPALGNLRKTSGICGSAIRKDAIQFMKDSSRIKKEEKLDFALIGCGGLMIPEHLSWMLDAGADVAMSATGMMWDPLLAIKYHQKMECHA